MADIDKIKEKILRLRAMVPERGASEAEALTALEKADKLMEEYGLTEADLRAAEAKWYMREGEFKYRMKAQHPSSKFCAMTIGAFCGVIPWYSARNQASKCFGFTQDVEMYEFLMKLIHDSMDREWKDFLSDNPPQKGVSRHTEYWSFMMGMANRINEKVNSLIKERKVKRGEETGTDLVEVKNAVVEQGMRDMLPDIKLKTSRARSIKGDLGAYGAGQAAGDRVNLNRPLRNGAGGVKSIGRRA